MDSFLPNSQVSTKSGQLQGVEQAKSMRPPSGAPSPVKPVHELAGEISLEIGQAEEAVRFYQTSLLRTPNRALSVRGLARAYAALDNRALAGEQYRKLQNIWSGYSVPGLKEASDYLTSTDFEGQ